MSGKVDLSRFLPELAAADSAAAASGMDGGARGKHEGITAVDLAAAEATDCPKTGGKTHLWQLALSLLKDGEVMTQAGHTGGFLSDDIPAERQWQLSQHALIQDALLRNPLLRKLCVVLQWLEASDSSTVVSPEPNNSELILLATFRYLRKGNFARAATICQEFGNAALACTIENARLKSVNEPWCHRENIATLFGEYAHSERDSSSFANNSQRLNLLASLFELSESTTDVGRAEDIFDTAIGGLISGHREATLRAFGPDAKWQDSVWTTIRCSVVLIFTKVLMSAGNKVRSPSMIAAINALAPADSVHWLSAAVGNVTDEILAFCRQVASHEQTSAEEALQLRLVCTFLANSSSMSDMSSTRLSEDCVTEHALLTCLDRAHQEGILAYDMQQSPCFLEAQRRYMAVIFSRTDIDLREACELSSSIAADVREDNKRARSLASVVRLARKRALSEDYDQRRIEAFEADLIAAFSQQECEKVGEDVVTEKVLAVLCNPDSNESQNFILAGEAEAVMWKSLSANTDAAFADAMKTCLELWADGKVSDIRDVVGVIGMRLVPKLKGNDTSMLAYRFWNNVVEADEMADEYVKCVMEFAAHSLSTKSDDLRRLEENLRKEIGIRCESAISLGADAMIDTDASVFILQRYADVLTIAIKRDAIPDGNRALHTVSSLVVQLQQAGLLESDVTSRAADDLLRSIRALRVTLNEVSHSRNYGR